MIKMQTFLKFALLSSTLAVYANEHDMASLLKNDASGILPSRGVPDMRGTLVQGNDRKAWIPKGRVLQDVPNCNASILDELMMDPTLNATYTTYQNNLIAAISAIDCQEGTGGAVKCTVPQSIDGQAEYQSACTAAGGQVETTQADIACDLTGTDGSAYTATIDFPPFISCFPSDASCAASIRAIVQNALDEIAGYFQDGLVASGTASDASCQVTNVASSAGKNGIGYVSMTMVVMSLIVSFHYF